MALVAAAAVAGTVAAAMYGEARTHIWRDLKAARLLTRIEKLYVEAARKNRLCLYYLFEEAVLKCGNNDCIWSREGCYTWNQAYRRVNQYAQWYLSQGVKPGDLVALYLMNSPDFMLAWLGLLSIGAAPALINYNLAGAALLHCLKVAGSKLMLVDEDKVLRARIEDIEQTLRNELGMNIAVMDNETLSQISSMTTERPNDRYREGVKGNTPVCLIFTSGTTGMPKGCPFNTDRAFMVGIMRVAGSTLAQDDDRWYNCMPLYHGTGGMISLSQMMSGVTLCLGKKFSTSKFWSDVHDSRATWITYVGETARYLLAAPPSPLDKDHCVRAMYGNGLRPDVWIKFRERFGITEVLEFFNSTEGVFGLAIHSKGDYHAGTVGHHGIYYRFTTRNTILPVQVDPATGAIARDPQTGFAIKEPFETGGEMIVKVPNEQVFSGYYGNEEATLKRFERNVFENNDLWYRSGDALRRTSDGHWYFLDRLGDTFRWKGENVSTAEVGEVVGNFPGVVEANVYGVQLPSHDGRAGCAAIYIKPADRDRFDFTGLLNHTRTHLPRYAVPIFLRIVQEMTPIHNNKQNKVPLRAEGVDPEKMKQKDQVMWLPAGAETYHPFTRESWDQLNAGKARL